MQKLPKNIPFPETPSGFGEAFIKDCRENPNNLSNWFPKVKDCGLRVPRTEIIRLTDEEINLCMPETPATCEAARAFIRERIPVAQGGPTIYGGLPFRPEWRVFYDFDSRRILYTRNYWDYDYCKDHLDEDDLAVFTKHRKRFELDYHQYLPLVIEQVDKALETVQGLSGVWSVDLMMDEEGTLWLIDMALGHQSAYWDPTKAMLFSFWREMKHYLLSWREKETNGILMAFGAGQYLASGISIDAEWKRLLLPFFLETVQTSRESLMETYFPKEQNWLIEEKERYNEKTQQKMDNLAEMHACRVFLRKAMYSHDALLEYLRSKDADFDDIYIEGDPLNNPSAFSVAIDVTWGDWKHSHGWLDHLMELRGFKLQKETVTEEDGSDCYSSTHIYSLMR